MKAETLLQYYIRLMKDSDNVLLIRHSLCKFYSQPFKPVMINEEAGLFENTFNLKGFMYGVGERDYIEIDGKTYMPMGKIKIPFGTLDQFVGDCHRFGIELVWKKEVIEQYFS